MAQKPLLSRDWTKGQTIRNVLTVRASIFMGEATKSSFQKYSQKRLLKIINDWSEVFVVMGCH
jgi:hypothetical protein